jgi:hypothetical protein
VPSGFVRSSTSWSKVGSPLTLVTVHVKDDGTAGPLPSLTLTVTLYGLPAAAVKAMVPVI